MGGDFCVRNSLAAGSGLQSGAVKLYHPHHRLHHTLGLRRVPALHQTQEAARDVLPKHAETIHQPTAALRLAPLHEGVPDQIDLGLRVECTSIEATGLSR